MKENRWQQNSAVKDWSHIAQRLAGSTGLHLVLLWLAAWFVPACAVEPIPTPLKLTPEQIARSSVDESGVTFFGRAGAAPGGADVVARNEQTGVESRGEADADGRFVLSVPADPNDQIALFIPGYEALAIELEARVNDEGLLAPGTGLVGTTPWATRPVDGLSVVTGPEGCVPPEMLVLVANEANGAVVEVRADDLGAFSVPIPAHPDDHLVLIAFVDEVGSTTVQIMTEECIGEGGSGSVFPNAPGCCEGLENIGCEDPDGEGGCLTCIGAFNCSLCGNGLCGPGENRCNCPQDCGIECGGIAGLICPDQQYCSYDGNSCGFADEMGYCVDRPDIGTCNVYDICPDVCGCDGQTYCDECYAAVAGLDVSGAGACE